MGEDTAQGEKMMNYRFSFFEGVGGWHLFDGRIFLLLCTFLLRKDESTLTTIALQ